MPRTSKQENLVIRKEEGWELKRLIDRFNDLPRDHTYSSERVKLLKQLVEDVKSGILELHIFRKVISAKGLLLELEEVAKEMGKSTDSLESVEVLSLPDCDIPGCQKKAKYDGRTKHGPWAYMCEEHFKDLGVGLGLGKGQELIQKEETVPNPSGAKKKTRRIRTVYEVIVDVAWDDKKIQKAIDSRLKDFVPRSKEVSLITKTAKFVEIREDD